MNKIVSTLAVVMAALTASAELYYATVNTREYEKDTSHDKTTGYSGYLCTAESAKDLFGGQTTVEDQTSYFAANYESVKDGLEAGASRGLAKSGISALAPDPVGYLQGQYSVTAFYGTGLAGDYIAVLLYSDSKDSAFRIFGTASAEAFGGSRVFDDNGVQQAVAGKFGAWTATTPEPTSGVLILLGLAGLALRRKRA